MMQRRNACRWIAATGLLCLVPLTGASAKQKPQPVKASPLLLEVSVYGGFRPNGPQNTVLLVRSNGQTTVNGKPSAPVAPAELQALSTAIRQANFREIRSRKGSGTRPSSYDGLDLVYTFHTPRGAEKVDNWNTEINPEHPLFRLADKVRQKYGAS